VTWNPLTYRPSGLVTLWLVSIAGTFILLWLLTSEGMLGGKVNGDISFGLIFLSAGVSLSLWFLIVYQRWARRGFLPGAAQEPLVGLVSLIKQVGRWYVGFTLVVFGLANVVVYGVSLWFLMSGIIRAIGGGG